MPIAGGNEKLNPVLNARIQEDGYLFINDKINFFTGDMEVGGRKQSFVLGVTVNIADWEIR